MCTYYLKKGSAMFKTLKKGALVASFSSVIILSGCAGSGMTNSETSAVVGTIVGGAIGHEFGKGNGRKVTTLLGAALGGYLGSTLGHNLDGYDTNNVNTALNNTPDNRQVKWNNNNSGANYAFTPTNSYQAQVNNRPTKCRNYTMLVDMGGRPEKVTGKACMVNGQWVTAQ